MMKDAYNLLDARGGTSKIDWYELTKEQLDTWGCKYHDIITGHRESIFCYPLKPSFDLVVDDKKNRGIIK